MHCCYYRPSATATPNSLMVVSSFVQTRELLSSLLLERWCRNNSCPCVSKFSTLKQIVQPAHPIVTEQRDRTPLPAALVCRAQAAVHFLIRISPDLPQLKCPLCLFSTSGRVIALVSWIRHDKGDDSYEEGISRNGRGARSPEHRWLRTIRRQGKGSSPCRAGRN
jgi:hypothetical protein